MAHWRDGESRFYDLPIGCYFAWSGAREKPNVKGRQIRSPVIYQKTSEVTFEFITHPPTSPEIKEAEHKQIFKFNGWVVVDKALIASMIAHFQDEPDGRQLINKKYVLQQMHDVLSKLSNDNHASPR